MERGEVKCGNIIILCEGHWVYSPLCVDAEISGPQIFLLVQNDSAGYISPHSSIALKRKTIRNCLICQDDFRAVTPLEVTVQEKSQLVP